MRIKEYISNHDLTINASADSYLDDEILRVEEQWDCVHIYVTPGFYFVGKPAQYADDCSGSHYEGDF